MDDLKAVWAGSTGLQFLGMIADGRIPLPPQVARLGLKLLAVRPGHVELAWQPALEMCNATGAAVHGGYISMVLDDCAGMSCASMTERLWPLLTLELRIDFLRPVLPGRDYRVVSQVVHRGSTRLVADARVLQGETDLLARASGSFVPNQRFKPSESTGQEPELEHAAVV